MSKSKAKNFDGPEEKPSVPTSKGGADHAPEQAERHPFAVSANDNDKTPENGEPEKPKNCLAYGPCAVYIPDNAKSLFGPSVAPSLTEIGLEIALPPTEMPTGKAKIERFFGTLKTLLRQLPLPVVDMIRADELNYDVGDHAIIKSQLDDLVAKAVGVHNDAPSGENGKPSPNQQLEQDRQQNARSLYVDVERVERAIGVTDQAILDRNGVVYDGLRYRHSERVGEMLKNMKQLGPDRVTIRKNGQIAIVVKILRNPGNLSSFLVYDEGAKKWVRLISTELEYTHMLSAAEHQLFQRRSKQRNEIVKGAEQRLASVAKTRAEMDEMVPDLSFQQRRQFAALCKSKEVQNKSHRKFTVPDPDTAFLDREIGTFIREDIGLPGDKEFSIRTAESNSGTHFTDKNDGDSFETFGMDDIDYDAIGGVDEGDY